MKSVLLSHGLLRGAYRRWWELRYGVSRDDVFLVSYPRSGNTWVRFMLLQARPGFEDADFKQIAETIPDMHGPHPWHRCRRTNIVKSHLTYWQPFRRVVYLVRDGRAATFSNWKYQRAQGAFSGSFADFVRQGHWPSSWSDHVTGWIAARETQLVIRYEDLLQQPARELAKIASLLGWPLSAHHASQIALNSTKQRMREFERDDGIDLHRVGRDESCLEEAYTAELNDIFLEQSSRQARPFLSSIP